MLSENLIRLRKSNGWPQELLAEKLDVSRQAISKWETGESMPDAAKLIGLADLFGCSLDELCGREVEKQKETPPTPGPAAKKKIISTMWLIFLMAGSLLIGGTAGYFLRSLHPPEPAPAVYDSSLIDRMSLSGVTLNQIPSSGLSTKFQITFVPSRTNDSLTYQVVKTDTYGNETTYDAPYSGGSCSCTFSSGQYSGFTLTAVISDGTTTYNHALIRVISCDASSFTFEELWKE